MIGWAQEEGALHLPHLFSANLDFWLELCSPYFARRQAGVRITNDTVLAQALREFVASEPLAMALGQGQWTCVRAIAFDKNPQTNWKLGWHQDRTIAVRERIDTSGFGPWSSKQGIQHVEPPFARIEAMRTLRMHFDPVDDDNGPLLVALGSQKQGKIKDSAVAGLANALPQLACHAAAGDGWLYATAIAHASGRSTSAARRRVLQLDFSPDSLPGELEWLGIG